MTYCIEKYALLQYGYPHLRRNYSILRTSLLRAFNTSSSIGTALCDSLAVLCPMNEVGNVSIEFWWTSNSAGCEHAFDCVGSFNYALTRYRKVCLTRAEDALMLCLMTTGAIVIIVALSIYVYAAH
jgi:hypothetical protein